MKNIINNKKYKNYVTKTFNPIITLSEKQSKYILKNKNKITIYKLQIDNGIIKTGVRCDYGIYYELKYNVANDKNLFLIELKGIDIEHAFEQLFETYKWFQKRFDKGTTLTYRIRIVCTKVCKSIQIEQGKKKFIKHRVTDIIVKEQITDSI